MEGPAGQGPGAGQQTIRIVTIIGAAIGKHVSNHWKKNADGEDKAPGAGAQEDIFPYVSFTVNFNK